MTTVSRTLGHGPKELSTIRHRGATQLQETTIMNRVLHYKVMLIGLLLGVVTSQAATVVDYSWTGSAGYTAIGSFSYSAPVIQHPLRRAVRVQQRTSVDFQSRSLIPHT